MKGPEAVPEDEGVVIPEELELSSEDEEEAASELTIVEKDDGEEGSTRIVEATPVSETDGERLELEDEAGHDPYDKAA